MLYLRSNFGYGFLASPVGTPDLTMTMAGGHNLPTSVGSFVVVLYNSSLYTSPNSDPNMEIMVASYSGTTNIYNIIRAQEGTSAATHVTGVKVAMFYTAGLSTADLSIIGSTTVDESSKGNGKVLAYNGITGHIEYFNITGSVITPIPDSSLQTIITPGKIALSALPSGIGGTTGTFTNASLASSILTVTHNLALSTPYILVVQVADNTGYKINPDNIIYATNSFQIDLTSFVTAAGGTIPGTWGYRYS